MLGDIRERHNKRGDSREWKFEAVSDELKLRVMDWRCPQEVERRIEVRVTDRVTLNKWHSFYYIFALCCDGWWIFLNNKFISSKILDLGENNRRENAKAFIMRERETSQSNGWDFLVKLIDEIITVISGRQNELSHILTIGCIYFYLTVAIFFNKILNSVVWDTDAVLQVDPYKVLWLVR